MAVKIMLGKTPVLRHVPLTPEGAALFREDFTKFVDRMRKIDPEIADSFMEHFDFYEYAAGIAKGAFFEVGFGGFEPSSGQFGMKELNAPDIGTINWEATSGRIPGHSDVHTWVKSYTLDANVSWADIFGSAGKPVRPSVTAEHRSLHAFHALVSWKPGTRLTAIRWDINEVPYTHFGVEAFSKIAKEGKTLRLIPLPMPVLIHPEGQYFMRGRFEKVDFTVSETYTEEIGILGLVFAQYNYLRTEVE